MCSVTQSRRLVCDSRKRTSMVFLAFLLLGCFLSACRSTPKDAGPVEVEVRQVGFDHSANSPVVILQDKDGKKTMPIWIGLSEAQAIALQLQGTQPPRPLTHDLLKNILEQVGVEFDRVLVTELKGSTYYARIHLTRGGKDMEVDSRPSDAIALAMRFHRPIFIERVLFETAPLSQLAEGGARSQPQASQVSAKMFGLTVQNLTDALAAYFELPNADGALVTEVEQESGADRLQRGDIIIAVKGEKVRGVEELRRKLDREQGQVVTVQVRRDGEEVDIPLSIAKEATSKTEEEVE